MTTLAAARANEVSVTVHEVTTVAPFRINFHPAIYAFCHRLFEEVICINVLEPTSSGEGFVAAHITNHDALGRKQLVLLDEIGTHARGRLAAVTGDGRHPMRTEQVLGH